MLFEIELFLMFLKATVTKSDLLKHKIDNFSQNFPVLMKLLRVDLKKNVCSFYHASILKSYNDCFKKCIQVLAIKERQRYLQCEMQGKNNKNTL